MQFLDMPALGGLGDAARQSAVSVWRSRKDTRGNPSGFFLENGGAFDGGQLTELRVQSGGVNAGDLNRDGSSPFGFLPQFDRRAIRDDLAAIDDDRSRANRVHFFENVRRKNNGFFLAHLSDETTNFVLLVRVQSIGRFVQH